MCGVGASGRVEKTAGGSRTERKRRTDPSGGVIVSNKHERAFEGRIVAEARRVD